MPITKVERELRKLAVTPEALEVLREAARIGADCDRKAVVAWLRKRHARWGTMATAIENGKHLTDP